MEIVFHNFWVWWALLMVWSGAIFLVGTQADSVPLMTKAATMLVIMVLLGMVLGSVQWLYYMQVWPFIPQ